LLVAGHLVFALVEAHKEEETRFSTALLIAGFVVFLLLGMAHAARRYWL